MSNIVVKIFKLVLLFFASSNIYAELNIQHWQINNGARIYFVETHDLPIVDIRIVFDAGSAREGDKYGLAALTNALIPTGSKNYTEDQLADIFENNGAQFSNDSLRDMSLFTLRSLRDPEKLNPVVDALSDILLQPTFPEEAFTRDVQRALISLKTEEQDQGIMTNKIFMRQLYKAHPYGHSPSGNRESIKAISPQDLMGFHKKHFIGNNVVVAIVGDLSLLEAKNLANTLIGRLPVGEPVQALVKVSLPEKPGLIETEFPSTQTHILIGQPGNRRGDPDYFPLYVGNHILGGSGLVSRISKEIRENRGLAYSAYSYFNPMREHGPFLIGMQTKNKNKQQSLEVLDKVVRDFIKHGPTAKELEDAKKNIVGGFPLRLDSNKKQLEYLAVIGFYQLPLDHLNTFSARVSAITLDNIKDAWQRRINPDKFLTVTVGEQKLE